MAQASLSGKCGICEDPIFQGDEVDEHEGAICHQDCIDIYAHLDNYPDAN